MRALGDLARRFSTTTVFLHQVFAQAVGLSATDTRCLDLILTEHEATMTAGRLAQLSGLTTGAITHILDRLEKRRFVARVRSAEDRRKVFLRVREESLKPLLPKYEALGKQYRALVEHYTDSELKLIFEYMSRISQMNERLIAEALGTAHADQT